MKAAVPSISLTETKTVDLSEGFYYSWWLDHRDLLSQDFVNNQDKPYYLSKPEDVYYSRTKLRE